MPYLVDGHNLIPNIPGLQLSDQDDEISLVQILGRFASQRRSRVEVYFDQAGTSGKGSRTFGLVRAHFIEKGSTADQAIKKRLNRLGRSARSWTVVTSDREILAEARDFHCQVLTSQEFSRVLQGMDSVGNDQLEKTDQPEISQDDISYWMDQFYRE